MSFFKHILLLLPLSYFILTLFSCSSKNTNSKTPNIVLVLTDDQAYGDLSFYGNELLETPHLDRFFMESTRAEQFYVSPLCAPTRASILTGRYHHRTGVSGVTRGRERMNLDEITIANTLKQTGYTTGLFGKWHNGANPPYHPLSRGFDAFTGFAAGHWPNYFDAQIEKAGQAFKSQGYLPDVIVTEALSFIENQAKEEKSFFCFVSLQTPHTPFQVPDAYFDYYKAKGLDDAMATLYGMCQNIDDNFGKLQKKLEALGIEENTIVLFMSDNGPINLRYNSGLKGRKGQVNEGGVRVPFAIRWKGNIPENRNINTPLAHIDLFPTLLDLIGHLDKKPDQIDGVSFKDLLHNPDRKTDRTLFEKWNGKMRALQNEWLLTDDGLFNLKSDIGQQTDVSSEYPKLTNKLKTAFKEWHAELPNFTGINKVLIGHEGANRVRLEASQAHLHPPFPDRKDRRSTGIAYHSLYGWAHDWIDFWTDTKAYPSWEIEVVNAGQYQIALEYALSNATKKTQLQLASSIDTLALPTLKPFLTTHLENFDRVPREQEAPVQTWTTLPVGAIQLEKGLQNITLKALQLDAEASIQIKSLVVYNNE